MVTLPGRQVLTSLCCAALWAIGTHPVPAQTFQQQQQQLQQQQQRAWEDQQRQQQQWAQQQQQQRLQQQQQDTQRMLENSRRETERMNDFNRQQQRDFQMRMDEDRRRQDEWNRQNMQRMDEDRRRQDEVNRQFNEGLRRRQASGGGTNEPAGEVTGPVTRRLDQAFAQHRGASRVQQAFDKLQAARPAPAVSERLEQASRRARQVGDRVWEALDQRYNRDMERMTRKAMGRPAQSARQRAAVRRNAPGVLVHRDAEPEAVRAAVAGVRPPAHEDKRRPLLRLPLRREDAEAT